jgi:NADH-quinone oxidoreductase subunit L
MRKMSGLKRVLPKTHILILIGCLALAGVPGLSGFFSKDEIVASVWDQSKFLGILLLLTAFLTAYYTFRLYFRVFQGPQSLPDGPAEGHGHAPEHDAPEHNTHHHGAQDHSHQNSHGGHQGHGHDYHHDHEPWIMMVPLIVLAIGALLSGYLNYPERHFSLHGFLATSPSFVQSHELATKYHGSVISHGPMGFEEADKAIAEKIHNLHWAMMGVSALIAGLGIYLAYLYHLKYRDRAQAVAARYLGLVRLLDHKYWVDEIYQAGIVEPLRSLGNLLFKVDRMVVDGLIWAISFIPQLFGFSLKLTTQRGSLQGYALMMLLGLAAILLFVFA